MSYVRENLLSGEEVRFEAKISYLSFIPHVILMLFCIGFITIIKPLIAYFTTEIAITNKRFILKKGLIARATCELMLGKIENIQVNQSAFGRMLGYGDVTVIGSGGTRETASFISDPQILKREVNAAIDAGK